jgi:hypothetical protein
LAKGRRPVARANVLLLLFGVDPIAIYVHAPTPAMSDHPQQHLSSVWRDDGIELLLFQVLTEKPLKIQGF